MRQRDNLGDGPAPDVQFTYINRMERKLNKEDLFSR